MTKRRVPAQTADELFDRLRANGPPPPWNDIPPLAPYLLSVGIFLGGMLERGQVKAEAVIEAANIFSCCSDVPAVVTLGWGVEWGDRAKAFYTAIEDDDARQCAERMAEWTKIAGQPAVRKEIRQ